MVFLATKMWSIGDKVIRKHKKYFKAFKEKVKREIELPLMRRLVPAGTVVKEVYTEKYIGKYTYARPVGSYPLMIKIPDKIRLGIFMNFTIVDHDHRSVYGIPYPLNINEASPKLINLIPGISKKEAMTIIRKRPFTNIKDLREAVLNERVLKYVTV